MQVVRWLNRHRRDLSYGLCHMDGDRISFSPRSPEGIVDYAGRISPDGRRLHLKTVSHINGHRSWEVLTFEALSEADLACRALYDPSPAP